VRKHGLSLGMCFVIGLPDDNVERQPAVRSFCQEGQARLRLLEHVRAVARNPGSSVYLEHRHRGRSAQLLDSHRPALEFLRSDLRVPPLSQST